MIKWTTVPERLDTFFLLDLQTCYCFHHNENEIISENSINTEVWLTWSLIICSFKHLKNNSNSWNAFLSFMPKWFNYLIHTKTLFESNSFMLGHKTRKQLKCTQKYNQCLTNFYCNPFKGLSNKYLIIFHSLVPQPILDCLSK